MSSILTNNGAMIALQTLKGINSQMGKTQSEISTGKSVANAKDNSAVWAISKVMESDVTGFKSISDSLSLGQSTVAVAQQASETVTDLLNKMKSKIVSSQESNVDRDKIQTDITALRDQIGAVVGAAQFNGLNLLSSTGKAGTGNVDVLSSLDRSSGGVAVSKISVTKKDLGLGAAKMGSAGGSAGTASTANTTIAGGASASFYQVAATPATGTTFKITSINGAAFAAGKELIVAVHDGETQADVQKAMINTLNFAAKSLGVNASFSADSTTAGLINMKNDNASTGANMASAATDVTSYTGATDHTVGGGLSLLNNFDVRTTNGAAAALAGIEGMIQTSVSAASNFGSVAGRLETQAKFVSSLTDSLKSGIGTLVDADMEETSARLQALQVQQQLGVQSLSIANQAPQSILSLFRG